MSEAPSKRYRIHIGDCSDVLPTLKKESFSGCLCDPPYGLNFSNAEWDGGVPSKAVWEKVFSCLLPGAFLIAYGGTRTFHRLACNIEDAGFQIRDNILFIRSPSDRLARLLSGLNEEQMQDLISVFGGAGLMAWMYGTGMPKSFDISKAFDRAAGVKREIAGMYRPPGMARDWNLKNAADDRTVNIFASSRNNLSVTRPGSKDGEVWDGFGTALKPVWEPIIVAMKPLDGDYISNARKYGVAGINIDATRLPLAPGEILNENEYVRKKSGRWPTNVIVEHDRLCSEECVQWCPVRDFKETGSEKNRNGISRFVYCLKPSKDERNMGLSGDRNRHPTLKPIGANEVLARLILPPQTGRERKILVPFSGTGSEMAGALSAGWDFAEGVEIDKGFSEIAEKRISKSLKG